jgi:peptidoglycan/LPS O-acetylase OafA/YrhL
MDKALRSLPDERIDLIRGIAIMGVVGIHFGGSFITKEYVWTGPFYMGLFLSEVSSFGVPAFVFLSGWALDARYSVGAINYVSFYRRRLIKIGIPYLIVSAVWLQILRDQPPFMGTGLFALFFYYGIQPTLFFIPLIMQLYILYPLFRFLSQRLAVTTGSGEDTAPSGGEMTFLTALLVLHLVLGYLSYTGKIDYYTYCRPFSPFWAFYFVAGMYFRRLKGHLDPKKYWKTVVPLLAVALAGLAVLDIRGLLDINRVGVSFETTDTYWAYSRPLIMGYNVVCVILTTLFLLSNWSFRFVPVEVFGRFSLYIYLLHLIVLGRYVWGRPNIIGPCTEYPAVILLVIVLVCAAIAVPGQCLAVTLRFIRSLVAGYRGATARGESRSEQDGR